MSIALNQGLRYYQAADYVMFDEALKSGKRIWVVNNSDPMSLLLITVTDPSSGKPHNLDIYRTFIPFCLSEMLPLEVLERSLQIRTFIRKGILKMLTEEEALKILSSDEGRREYQRLMTSEHAKGASKGEAAQHLVDNEKFVRQQLGNTDIRNPGIDYTQIALHPKLRGWEGRVMAEELDGPSLMTELLIHGKELTKQDLDFMLASQFPKEAKEFASKKLAEGNFAEQSRGSTPDAPKPGLPGVHFEPDFEIS